MGASLPTVNIVQAKSDGAVQVITDPTRVIPTDTCFVLFYGDFCGHCTHVKPHFEAIAKSLPKVRFAKCEHSVIQASGKAQELGINGYPHFGFFVNGTQKSKMIGNQGADKLKAWVNENLV
jgi:thiol-disulfide isomerase/thioredoxin